MVTVTLDNGFITNVGNQLDQNLLSLEKVNFRARFTAEKRPWTENAWKRSKQTYTLYRTDDYCKCNIEKNIIFCFSPDRVIT